MKNKKRNVKKNTAKSPVVKKKTKPKKLKLWGLEFKTYNKAAQQYVDQDYINKLNYKEKEWLSQFNEEYYNNTLNKDWRKNLHMKENKYDIYDQTNARNRDMYNKRYKYNEGDINQDHNIETLVASKVDFDHASPEESYCEFMDKEKNIRKFMEEAKASGLNKQEVLDLTRKVFDLD